MKQDIKINEISVQFLGVRQSSNIFVISTLKELQSSGKVLKAFLTSKGWLKIVILYQ